MNGMCFGLLRRKNPQIHVKKVSDSDLLTTNIIILSELNKDKIKVSLISVDICIKIVTKMNTQAIYSSQYVLSMQYLRTLIQFSEKQHKYSL